MAKSKKMKGEVCETGKCKCSIGMWLIPLLIVILLWAWPTTASKIIITILAVLGALAHLCPCKNK